MSLARPTAFSNPALETIRAQHVQFMQSRWTRLYWSLVGTVAILVATIWGCIRVHDWVQRQGDPVMHRLFIDVSMGSKLGLLLTHLVASMFESRSSFKQLTILLDHCRVDLDTSQSFTSATDSELAQDITVIRRIRIGHATVRRWSRAILFLKISLGLGVVAIGVYSFSLVCDLDRNRNRQNLIGVGPIGFGGGILLAVVVCSLLWLCMSTLMAAIVGEPHVAILLKHCPPKTVESTTSEHIGTTPETH